jgi:hypothetical protein
MGSSSSKPDTNIITNNISSATIAAEELSEEVEEVSVFSSGFDINLCANIIILYLYIYYNLQTLSALMMSQ